MRSNLPPGVTDGMLPGNRREDADYETFCEGLALTLDDLGLTELEDGVFDKLAEWVWDVKERAHGIGYKLGEQEGIAQHRDDIAKGRVPDARGEW